MTPDHERARRSREQRQRRRALEAAALALTLAAGELAQVFERLPAGRLEHLKWDLAEASAVTQTESQPRREFDAYFTDPAVAAAIVHRIDQVGGFAYPKSILEPSAGLGAFVRAARFRWDQPPIWAIDLRLRPALMTCIRILQDLYGRPILAFEEDFLQTQRANLFELVLGNPPYLDAERHVEQALRLLAPGGRLAFLLRLGFAGSLERAEGLWRGSGLEYVAPIAPRPSFTGGGTDSQEYALFVWRRGYAGEAKWGRPIVWKGKQAPSEVRLTSRGAA